MKVVDDEPGRLRFVGVTDWLRVGIGLAFLLLPLFPFFLEALDAPSEPPAHRALRGTRTGAEAVLVLTERQEGRAPRTWRTEVADVARVAIASQDHRNRRGRAYKTYSLALHMRQGAPWPLFSSYSEAPLRAQQRALEAFLADPARASVLVEEPPATGRSDRHGLMLAVGLPCGLLALWLLHGGLAARRQGMVLDRQRRTVVVSGRPGGDLTLPFDAIVGVVPFDPQDRRFTDTFALVLDTTSHGLVRLGELPNPRAGALDGLGRGKGPNEAEIASARAAHAELAGRIAALLGLQASRRA